MSYIYHILALLALFATVTTLNGQSNSATDNTSVSDSNNWLDNTIGMNTKSVPLFPNVVTNTTDVSIGNKRYDLLDRLLPIQIRIDATELLAAPLELQLDGVTIGDEAPTIITVIQSSNSLFHTDRQIDLENYQLSNQMKISPDGFIANAISITPNSPTTINSLKIVFKLNKKYANHLEQYFPYDYVKQRVIRQNGENSNRAIDGNFTFPFTPIMWLGNPEAGVEILMENNISYSLSKPGNANAIELKDGYVQLTHTIIDKPVRVTKPLTYNIGILTTPTKEKKKQPRNFLLTSRSSRVSKISHFSEIHVGHWKRDGFPYPGIPEAAKIGSPDRAMFKDRVNKLEKQAIKHIPYSALHMMVSTLPELANYSKEWASGPANRGSIHLRNKIDHPKPSQPVTLDSRSIQDFLIHKHSAYQHEHESNGIYVDVAMPNQAKFTTQRKIAQSNNHFNKSAVHFPIFSHRNYLQRYWTALKLQSDNFTIVHHGNKLPHYVQSFIDIAVIGESIHTLFKKQGKMRLKKVNGKQEFVNPGDYKPNYFGLSSSEFPGIGTLNSGTRQVIIPQVLKFNDSYLKNNPEKFEKWSRSILAVALLNDLQMWNTRLSPKIFEQFITTLESFPEFANAEFHKHQLLNQSELIESALYKGQNYSLLVLANYGKSLKQFELTRNILKLPQDAKYILSDMEFNTGLQATQVGHIMDLPAEDFRLILVTIEN